MNSEYQTPHPDPLTWDRYIINVFVMRCRRIFNLFFFFFAKTVEVSFVENLPNESKLIYVINTFTVVFSYLLYFYISHFNTKENFNFVPEHSHPGEPHV